MKWTKDRDISRTTELGAVIHTGFLIIPLQRCIISVKLNKTFIN